MSTRTPEWANEPDYEYVAYIDEAGDPGIERVRPIDPAGSTEWFVLAAVVIRKSREAEVVGFIRDLLQELKIRGRTNLHFRSMSESKKLRACERLAKFNARLFVVASNKKNMRKHRNKNAEKTSGEISSGQVIYNYCSRLLLERVTDFAYRTSLAEHGVPKLVKVVFSKRGGHNYGQQVAYLELLKNQSRAGTTLLQKRTMKWHVFDLKLVKWYPHWCLGGLQLADIVASSFYQAIDILDVKIRDARFAKALRPTMTKEGGFVADYGLCLQPHIKAAKLTQEQEEIFKFYGYQT